MQGQHFRLGRPLTGQLVQHPNITGEEIKAREGTRLNQCHESVEKKNWEQNHVFQPQIACLKHRLKSGFNF